MTRLDAAEYERAITWNLTIAAELLGAPSRDEGRERCWEGGFHVCRQSGAWYSWAASVGGVNSVSLIQFLKKCAGEEWSFEDTIKWLVKFLTTHEGLGQLEAAAEDEEDTQTRQAATAELARHVLDIAEPLPEDGAEVAYLTSRALPGPYHLEALRWLPNARPGEGALVMPLTANERITGVLLTYIDALGKKSLVAPVRRRLDIERAPGAVMVIQEPAPGVVDISATVVIAEGLENSLSVAHPEVAHPGWKIIGVPGIATLKNVPAKAGDRIIVFQDSDPEGQPAQIGLQAGIDGLILQGAQVRRTERSEHGDANAILRAKGPVELKRLLARPAGAPLKFTGEKLSVDGEIVRLAKLSPTEYEKERKKVAKDSEWRVAARDKAVARLRPASAPSEDEGSTEPSIRLPVDPPWTGPVPQLSQLLDRVVIAIRRYVVLEEWQAHIVTVWVALTYFVFASRINLQVMPRLAIQSAEIASGKTSLLRIVCTLVRHGKIYGRSTAAGIYRALSQAELTLCLDEVEFLRYDPHSPMMQVLDSSHHREDANILLAEPQPVGPPIARELSTWAAMALACNGQLPGALQSRSVIILLRRALPEEAPEYLETRSTPELVDLRRQLSAWASTVAELPLPKREEMPAEVYNRVGQNWRPLFAIARLAGEAWVARIENAATESIKTETLPTLIERLLASVKRAFGENPKPKTWLDSTELAARLIAQEGEQWATINRGGAVDAYWLRKNLVGLLQPAGAQDWWQTLPEGGQRHRSGYVFDQFADAFRRHPEAKAGVYTPDDTHTENPPKKSGVSGVSGGSPKDPKETAIFDTPDGSGASGVHRVYEKASESAADEPLTPGTPDTPDPSGAVCEEVSEPDEFAWMRGPQPPTAEPDSTAEPAKASESLDPETSAKARPTARPARAKPRPAPQLDLPEPSILDYIEGSIAEEIRQLRAANPKRSPRWIAKQSGQPTSVVREILGNGEGAP
jgi:hypothetical protein